MIWDRMLGSAVDELDDKPCLYGLDARQKPLGTHNPSWHQVFFECVMNIISDSSSREWSGCLVA